MEFSCCSYYIQQRLLIKSGSESLGYPNNALSK